MPAPRRGAALAAALLIVVALAGCGQAAKAHASVAALSSAPFVGLRAVRSSAFPGNDVPAFDHTGIDAAAIAKLYDAVAALRPYPANADYFCPADFGLLYHLTFTRADGSQVTGEAKPDGCEYANIGDGPKGNLLETMGFWPLFAAALDVPVSALQYQP
jgi:hypothetical protein